MYNGNNDGNFPNTNRGHPCEAYQCPPMELAYQLGVPIMPIKSTRVKMTIDEASNCFILRFTTEAGLPNDPYNQRHITLFTWDEVQATVEIARRGNLESDAEVKTRQAAGKPPKLTTETLEAYITRGGKITRIEQKKRITPPRVDDLEGWEKLLSDMTFESNPPATVVGKPKVTPAPGPS